MNAEKIILGLYSARKFDLIKFTIFLKGKLNIMKKYKVFIFTSIISITLLPIIYSLSKKWIAINSSFGKASYNALDVSLINLIATPKKYDGKLVRVNGISNVEFEGNALYLSKYDYKKRTDKNAMWLDIDSKLLETTYRNLQKLNGEYVLIEGVFNSSKKGHFNSFSGTIENITRYEFGEMLFFWEEFFS